MKRLLTILFCLLLCACTANSSELIKEKSYLGYLQDEDGKMVLPLNTDCYLTTVKPELKEEMVSRAKDLLYTYHKHLDSHKYYKDNNGNRINNLRVVNESFSKEVVIDDILFEAIKESIEIAKLTKGYFNPTIGKVSDCYNGKFLSYDSFNTDPIPELLNGALSTVVPYDKLDEHIILNETNKSVTLIPYNDKEFEIDLGAFSKGYVSEKLYKELIKFNSSFILNCGSSSIITYNNPEENIDWTVGIKVPDKQEEMLYAQKLNNCALSTSGDYEQYYFLEDGTRRHHILNPFTGVSENYYREIVLSTNEKAGLIDALTTALYSIEDTNEAIKLIHEIENYYNIKINYCFVKDGYNLVTNKETKESFIDNYTSSEIKNIDVIE